MNGVDRMTGERSVGAILKATTPYTESPVFAALRACDESLSRLNDLTCALGNRLQPISLHVPEASELAKGCAKPSMSTVLARLDDIHQAINAQCDTVREMLTDIQL